MVGTSGWWLWSLLMIFIFWWVAYPWWPGYRWRGGYGSGDAWGYGGRPVPPYGGFWPSRQRPGIHRGKGPAGYRRSDEHIAEDVNDALMMSDELDATGISVRVESSVVTLSGSVSSRTDKRLAEALTDSIAGVTDIKNELRIGAAPTNKAQQTESTHGGPA